LRRGDDGWFCADISGVKAGTRYKFRIDDEIDVPDPASAFQPDDVSGPSEVIDHASFRWRATDWRGHPWPQAVVLESHVGTFTPEGSYRAMIGKLDHLVASGITALELMPLADFAGSRNWGYDGVLWYAPDSAYGRPDDLKTLIDEAHLRGLMVFLDVVYNHFGPVGNYLHRYAPQFFTTRHRTPWGHAINFDGEDSRVVRDFFIDNALYWLDEFHFDGLRLDAVHAICDDSTPHFLDELAATVRQRCAGGRHVHLILENDDNAANFLTRDADGAAGRYTAQWNDDIHHSLHTCLTGERDGYYVDYADAPLKHLGRCLTAGFAYQGEHSPLRGRARGSSTAGLPLTAFVSFLQNHDQVGNRAFGERLTVLAEPAALAAAIAIVLLAPSPPLLFMGEEFGATTPFLYFCDFDPPLAEAVRAGRLKEFARFARFADAASAAAIPDPQAAATFTRSKLDWESSTRPEHASWPDRYRELLRARRDVVIPMLAKLDPPRCGFAITGPRSLAAHWSTDDGARLMLFANLGGASEGAPALPPGKLVYTTGTTAAQALASPWSTTWLLIDERPEATRNA
jgi:malto-oligosyltrehalose trehalohydrolase